MEFLERNRNLADQSRFAEAMRKIQQKSLEERRAECKRIFVKKPSNIPVIVIPAKGIQLDKLKYICDNDMTIEKLNYVIVRRIISSTPVPERAYFFITEDKQIPPTDMLIRDLYRKQKNEDFTLHLYLIGEDTFGCD